MSNTEPTALAVDALERVSGGYDDYDFGDTSSYDTSSYDTSFDQGADQGFQGSGYEYAGYQGGDDTTYADAAQVAEGGGAAPTPVEVGRTQQTFDDGTSLSTYTYDSGITVTQAREQNVQTFDDGSRLITNTDTYNSVGSQSPGTTYTNTYSVDSLEARLADRPFFDHPATASPQDIMTAQDVLQNYSSELLPNERAILNDYVNGYYTGTAPPVFNGLPPTPRNYPSIDQRGSGVI